MSLIALLTDFGFKDEYVGVLKGVISKINPQAHLIDLCHEIPPQDILWASYCLASSYCFFPRGTIFLCVVDPGVGTKRRIIIAKTRDYFFVAPDNGLLSKILEKERNCEFFEVKNKKFFLRDISSTFHGRDIMAPVAAYISQGITLPEFGPLIRRIKKIFLPKPLVEDKKIFGEVIYIDRFGNLITNIDRNFFAEHLSERKFFIWLKDKKIFRINSFYAQSKKGELLAIWGSRNLLEIAINCGNVSKDLGIIKGEKVMVKIGS